LTLVTLKKEFQFIENSVLFLEEFLLEHDGTLIEVYLLWSWKEYKFRWFVMVTSKLAKKINYLVIILKERIIKNELEKLISINWND